MVVDRLAQKRQDWNQNLNRGGRGGTKAKQKRSARKTRRGGKEKGSKSRIGRGREQRGNKRFWKGRIKNKEGGRKSIKGQRNGRSDLPPKLPFTFVNKVVTVDGNGQKTEICRVGDGCAIPCNATELVCVERRGLEGCAKLKCVRLCGDQKTPEELNGMKESSVICDQAEECVKGNQMCTQMSFSRDTVLASLEGLKMRLTGLIAGWMVTAGTDKKSLMMREFCKDHPSTTLNCDDGPII